MLYLASRLIRRSSFLSGLFAIALSLTVLTGISARAHLN